MNEGIIEHYEVLSDENGDHIFVELAFINANEEMSEEIYALYKAGANVRIVMNNQTRAN